MQSRLLQKQRQVQETGGGMRLDDREKEIQRELKREVEIPGGCKK